MKRSRWLLLIGIVVFCLLAVQAAAVHKTLMGFQGKVTNASGAAVTSGNLTINISTGQNCLAEVFNRTYINNFTRDGIFDIMLGAVVRAIGPKLCKPGSDGSSKLLG